MDCGDGLERVLMIFWWKRCRIWGMYFALASQIGLWNVFVATRSGGPARRELTRAEFAAHTAICNPRNAHLGSFRGRHSHSTL